METLFTRHDLFITNTSLDIVREKMTSINWNTRLSAIVGARGVGKSTMILQHIKMNYAQYDRSVLYCSLDSVYFSTHTLTDLVQQFAMIGGKRLFFDEVHKYENWSKEIKEIYDLYPDIRITISGSSLLQILNADADLSRRCIRYMVDGLSFREFLLFYKGIELPSYPLDELLKRPEALCAEVNEKCKPVQMFKEYLKYGYYPFYLEGADEYYNRIDQVVNFVIDVELPLLRKTDISNTRKIKALISMIASGVPFEMDASKLSRAIGIGRDTIVEYMSHIADARIFNLLYSDAKSIGRLTRPDKIYLENSNLLYALSSNEVNIGTARETFVVSQLGSCNHLIEYGRQKGDFRVDGKYTFEVGGKDKTFTQIAGVKDSYILADDIETPLGRKLPIWIAGFCSE